MQSGMMISNLSSFSQEKSSIKAARLVQGFQPKFSVKIGRG
jgi:hypothetical protein